MEMHSPPRASECAVNEEDAPIERLCRLLLRICWQNDCSPTWLTAGLWTRRSVSKNAFTCWSEWATLLLWVWHASWPVNIVSIRRLPGRCINATLMLIQTLLVKLGYVHLPLFSIDKVDFMIEFLCSLACLQFT